MWYVYHKHTGGIYGKYYLEPDAKKKCRKLNRTNRGSFFDIEEVEEGTPDKKVKTWLLMKRPAGYYYTS